MDPITLGIVALAAMIFTGCGSDSSLPKKNSTSNDAGTAETGGRGDAGGTGGSTSSGGSGGASGSSGSGGIGGSSGMDGSVGMDASSYVDASTYDAADQISVPYSFGLLYGTTNIKRFFGTGTLYFSGPNNCQLMGGTMDAHEVGQTQTFGVSFNVSANQSIDFCASQVTLPMAGGIFNGVNLMLTNISLPLSTKDKYQITACTPQGDAGVTLEQCEGGLNMASQ